MTVSTSIYIMTVDFSPEVLSERANLSSRCLCGPSALTDSKHHFRFSLDKKVRKGRTVRNGAFKGWCYFVYMKLITAPQGTLPPFSYPEAGLLGPQVWGCGQAEETLPSWLELALDVQQLFKGKSLVGFCGAGL